jgi:hypothetical protein
VGDLEGEFMAQVTWGRPVAVVATAAAAAGAALVWTAHVPGLRVSLAYLVGGDQLTTDSWWLSCGAALLLSACLSLVAAAFVSRAWAVTGALLALTVTVGFAVRLALDPVVDQLSASDLGSGLKLSFLAGVLAMVAAFGVGEDD